MMNHGAIVFRPKGWLGCEVPLAEREKGTLGASATSVVPHDPKDDIVMLTAIAAGRT